MPICVYLQIYICICFDGIKDTQTDTCTEGQSDRELRDKGKERQRERWGTWRWIDTSIFKGAEDTEMPRKAGRQIQRAGDRQRDRKEDGGGVWIKRETEIQTRNLGMDGYVCIEGLGIERYVDRETDTGGWG